MGMFDYKDYGTEKSKAIVEDAIGLVSRAQLVSDKHVNGWQTISGKELGYDAFKETYLTRISHNNDIAKALNKALPSLELERANNPHNTIVNNLLTERENSVKLLGNFFGEKHSNDGTFFGEHADVASAQVSVSGKYDAHNKLIGIGIAFQGSGGDFMASSPILGTLDSLADFTRNNFRAAADPKGFGTEYPYLAFGKLLSSVATYAKQHGLTGKDVTITGASLGGMAVNSMADISNDRWGGFYKDSNFVAIASYSQTLTQTQKVLNIGTENDPVFRMMKNGTYSPLSLLTHDNPHPTTTDNIISFNDAYAKSNPNTPQLFINTWSAGHDPKELATLLPRITDSHFYNLTYRDSNVIVSSLSQELRETTWIENREHNIGLPKNSGEAFKVFLQKSGQYDAPKSGPTFILGTEHNDKLRGGNGTDYLEGGRGNDVFEDRGGYNIILGGQGYDSMNLQGSLSQFEVAYDSAQDGGANTLYIRDGKGGISLLRGVETLTTQEMVSKHFYFLVFKSFKIGENLETVTHDVTDGGLRSGNDLKAYQHSVNGDDGTNKLKASAGGDWLFGKMGNDELSSTKANVTFVGGGGDDILISNGGGSNTFLFDGVFGNDKIHNFKAADKLNFIGVEGVTDNFDYRSFAKEVNGDTVLTFGESTVALVGVSLDSLSSSSVVIA
ncbi:hypothetical protein ALP29_00928 [Pseudomonas syringae pv. avii]|uniref:Calcium-binding protein n=1 Tax=Pseudomonas syringae pv. avii TaxID=663959 RepID=A0A3M5VX71_PSESX|nr:calcium-binding protein [Pseudomonas azotoformans]RMT58836.1 hypothetical protein ALP43_03123 [Pseudomonas azotoformans]RMU62932.1 hypothetical protein ALP29_00928 [Pseudomonas syringae pv. avii]